MSADRLKASIPPEQDGGERINAGTAFPAKKGTGWDLVLDPEELAKAKPGRDGKLRVYLRPARSDRKPAPSSAPTSGSDDSIPF